MDIDFLLVSPLYETYKSCYDFSKLLNFAMLFAEKPEKFQQKRPKLSVHPVVDFKQLTIKSILSKLTCLMLDIKITLRSSGR